MYSDKRHKGVDMRNQHAINYLPRVNGQAICSKSQHLYSIKFDVYKHVQTPEFKKDCLIILKIKHIDIYRTPWATYIVYAWTGEPGKPDIEIYRQYDSIKKAWTYKRGLMRHKPGEFNNINLEWNRDAFNNSTWRI